jgi:hypothetical protein
MRILIIDDAKERHDGLNAEYNEPGTVRDQAYNYSESIEFLNLYNYDLICFDHDLNNFDADGKELTGATIARFMADNGMKCREVRVHSHNPEGAKNIISIIRSGDVSELVYYQPFSIFPGASMKGLKSWRE